MNFLNKLFPLLMNVVVFDETITSFKPLSGHFHPTIYTLEGEVMTCVGSFSAVINGYTLSFRSKFTFLVEKGYEHKPKQLLDILEFGELECYNKNGKQVSPAINMKGEEAIIKKFLNNLRYCDYSQYNEEKDVWEMM